MERREFIAGICTAVAMPFVAWAQQGERVRRIGVLMPLAKDNPEARVRIAAFLEELQRLGWTGGRNLQVEYRWETGEPNFHSKAAMELVALSPDVILATATPAVAALQRATRTVPIIFAQVADPVGSGFVANLARPGGNMTGFTNIDYEISAKWLQLLKEIAPYVTRVGVIRDPTLTSGIGQYGAIRSAAQALGVEVSALGGRSAADVEQTITEFARTSNGGLISVANR
jgi:putative ABC transport system substrate-binding protein